MELVFVYIGKYKNIEDQQFNLSRSHFIEFKNDELTYKKIDTKIQNSDFFPGCISNITAFVGENGSGKSSLIEFLMNILYSESSRSQRIYRNPMDGFAIYLDNDLFSLISNNGKYYSLKKREFPFLDISKNIEFDGVERNISEYFSIIYHSSNIKNSSTIKNSENDFLDISDANLLYEGIKGYMSNKFYKKKEVEYDDHDRDILPEFIIMNIYRKDISKYLHFLSEFPYISSLKFKKPNIIRIFGYELEMFSEYFFSEQGEPINRLILLWEYFISAFSFYFKNKSVNIKISSEKEFYKLLDEVLFDIDNPSKNKIDFIEFCIKLINSLAKKISSDHDISELGHIVLLNDVIDKFSVQSSENNRLIFDWSFDNKSVASLSKGEDTLLSLFSRVYDLKLNRSLKKNLLVFLDEPDISLHPSSQLALLNDIIDCFNSVFSEINGVNLQLFITSHSPFIVSDLPVDNIIHLYKDANGKTTISPMKEKIERTFAANIYDLYKSSFLLMGEGRTTISDFSRNKINQLLDRLIMLKSNPNLIEENDSDKLKEFIDMIGEPLIRIKMEELYFDIFNSDENTMINYYQEKIDLLRKKQENNDTP